MCTDDGEVSPELMARVVAYALVDDQGNQILASEEGVEEVATWPYAIVQKLFNVYQEMAEDCPTKKSTTK